VQASPFTRGLVPFNKILPIKDLQEQGSTFITGAPHLQLGSQVEVSYLGNKQFAINDEKEKLAKGNVVTCRFIKSIFGRGVTV
jgi:hypothetical protein